MISSQNGSPPATALSLCLENKQVGSECSISLTHTSKMKSLPQPADASCNSLAFQKGYMFWLHVITIHLVILVIL